MTTLDTTAPGNPCAEHPTTKVCTLHGKHLDSCWEPELCHGCRPCVTHNRMDPRPVQRPASTTDARKRRADTIPPAPVTPRSCGCGDHEITRDGIQIFDGTLIHQEGLCTAPDGQGPGA